MLVNNDLCYLCSHGKPLAYLRFHSSQAWLAKEAQEARGNQYLKNSFHEQTAKESYSLQKEEEKNPSYSTILKLRPSSRLARVNE